MLYTIRFFVVLTITLAFLYANRIQAARPNVLMIMIDDLNDWVGFLNGHPQVQTPHMDNLAARGTVFTNAHCAAPLCCPSRAAIFSGVQPFHSGVYTNNDRIRRLKPDLKLLPQHFRDHGFRTLGTGKLLHRKFDDLFDEVYFPEQRWSPFQRSEVEYSAEELPSKGTDHPRHVISARRGMPEIVLPLNRMPSDRAPRQTKGESFDWGSFAIPDSAMGDGKITDWAIKKLDGLEKENPFFLAVGYYRPHIPLFAPQKYFRPYPVREIMLPKTAANDLQDLSNTGRKVALEAVTAGSHATVIKHKQWQAAVASYLACVTFVDAQIGRLMKSLDAGPHADNTIIVLCSDHGWHLGEKQHWGKWTGWERSTRVPFVIVPASNDGSAKRSSRVADPVSLIDIYPTLLDVCELNAPHPLGGQSLTSYFTNPNQSTNRMVLATFDRGRLAVRDRRFRLIRYNDMTEELYDLQKDPHEFTNLIDQSEFRSARNRLSTPIDF